MSSGVPQRDYLLLDLVSDRHRERPLSDRSTAEPTSGGTYHG